MCAYNSSPTWTKGSRLQDSLCRNLQGVRLAARAKVWFFQGETAQSGRQGRHIEVCISSGFKSTLHNFLKPILKFQVFLGPFRPSGSRETPKKKPSVHFFGEAKALHQVDVEALWHALSGPRTGRRSAWEWAPWNMKNDCRPRNKKANHRL